MIVNYQDHHWLQCVYPIYLYNAVIVLSLYIFILKKNFSMLARYAFDPDRKAIHSKNVDGRFSPAAVGKSTYKLAYIP